MTDEEMKKYAQENHYPLCSLCFNNYRVSNIPDPITFSLYNMKEIISENNICSIVKDVTYMIVSGTYLLNEREIIDCEYYQFVKHGQHKKLHKKTYSECSQSK